MGAFNAYGRTLIRHALTPWNGFFISAFIGNFFSFLAAVGTILVAVVLVFVRIARLVTAVNAVVVAWHADFLGETVCKAGQAFATIV